MHAEDVKDKPRLQCETFALTPREPRPYHARYVVCIAQGHPGMQNTLSYGKNEVGVCTPDITMASRLR